MMILAKVTQSKTLNMLIHYIMLSVFRSQFNRYLQNPYNMGTKMLLVLTITISLLDNRHWWQSCRNKFVKEAGVSNLYRTYQMEQVPIKKLIRTIYNRPKSHHSKQHSLTWNRTCISRIQTPVFSPGPHSKESNPKWSTQWSTWFSTLGQVETAGCLFHQETQIKSNQMVLSDTAEQRVLDDGKTCNRMQDTRYVPTNHDVMGQVQHYSSLVYQLKWKIRQ